MPDEPSLPFDRLRTQQGETGQMGEAVKWDYEENSRGYEGSYFRNGELFEGSLVDYLNALEAEAKRLRSALKRIAKATDNASLLQRGHTVYGVTIRANDIARQALNPEEG